MRMLIVTDNMRLRGTLVACCQRAAPGHLVHAAASAQNALELERLRPTLLIIDLAAPSALGVVHQQRTQLASLPILAVTSRVDASLVNELYDLGVPLLCTPLVERRLTRFVRAALSEVAPDGGTNERLYVQAQAWQLTPRELEVLALCLNGNRPYEIPGRLRISRNTFRSHVKSLLSKSGQPTLAAAVRHVLLQRSTSS